MPPVASSVAGQVNHADVGESIPEDHGDRDDEQDDPAGDAQGARGEVQQPGQQPAEDQQENGDGGGGGQHLAQDKALGGPRHLPSRLEERHKRDLGADSDQQQQEKVARLGRSLVPNRILIPIRADFGAASPASPAGPEK